MKDYFDYQGASMVTGSRDATREALKRGLIISGEEWMSMIQSRNHTSHTYNESVANEIAEKILESYFPLFEEFRVKMEQILSS